MEEADGLDRYLVKLAALAVQADERGDDRGRRLRVGEEGVGEVAHEAALCDVADDASLLRAVARGVVDELADARAPVVRSDEEVLVRSLARPLHGSRERVCRVVGFHRQVLWSKLFGRESGRETRGSISRGDGPLTICSENSAYAFTRTMSPGFILSKASRTCGIRGRRIGYVLLFALRTT